MSCERLSGKRRIYVASSWRNLAQPGVIAALRRMGHEVYDFRNPAAGNDGFHWSEIDRGWQAWDGGAYLQALKHPVAEAGFKSDFDAMQWADTFVLVQPCGRSAHLEMGWAAGQGKATIMMLGPHIEPELMAKMCDHICVGLGAVLELFELLEDSSLSLILKCNLCCQYFDETDEVYGGQTCPTCQAGFIEMSECEDEAA